MAGDAFRFCKWCGGSGCMCCAQEAAKYEKERAERLKKQRAASPPVDLTPRYEPGRYRDCPHCHGAGCPKCDEEADSTYKRAFPNGPEPIFTAKTDDPRDMAISRSFLGSEALEKAFGPDGRGAQEVLDNAKVARMVQEGKSDHEIRHEMLTHAVRTSGVTQ